MPKSSNGKYPMIGGARWSRNRNFHSKLCLDVNSLLLQSTIGISLISLGAETLPVPTKTNLKRKMLKTKDFQKGRKNLISPSSEYSLYWIFF